MPTAHRYRCSSRTVANACHTGKTAGTCSRIIASNGLFFLNASRAHRNGSRMSSVRSSLDQPLTGSASGWSTMSAMLPITFSSARRPVPVPATVNVWHGGPPVRIVASGKLAGWKSRTSPRTVSSSAASRVKHASRSSSTPVTGIPSHVAPTSKPPGPAKRSTIRCSGSRDRSTSGMAVMLAGRDDPNQ